MIVAICDVARSVARASITLEPCQPKRKPKGGKAKAKGGISSPRDYEHLRKYIQTKYKPWAEI
jgi:hypothetical protein